MIEKKAVYKQHQETDNYFILKKVEDYKQYENQLILEFEPGEVILQFITDSIVRVVMGNRKDIDLDTGEAIENQGRSYHDFKIEREDDFLHVITTALRVKINLNNFGISFYDLKDNLINSDVFGQALGRNDNEVRSWKKIRENERFYGLGEKTGFLDKKDMNVTMWNTDNPHPHVPTTDPLYQSIPFYIGFNSGQAYGIYYDNTYKSHFDMGHYRKDYVSFRAEGGQLDYYFINGPDIKEVIGRYVTLTGRMQLPPLWSLGYHQSRYSYYPEDEVREIAQKFRDKQIPCDVIHLDIHYMDDYRVFTWDEDRFPDPEKLMSDLAEEGFKIVTIVDPGVKKDAEYEVYKEGVLKDYFIKYLDGNLVIEPVWPGDSAFPDFTKKEVREWWGDLHHKFINMGVSGIWNDMNEPAVFSNEKKTLSDPEIVHDNDGDIDTHRRFHNVYGLLEGKSTYQALKKYTDSRPFVLTRAGFAGIQRYAAVWTGDNRSFWEHMQMAMPMLMNLGMSGVAFCGTDVGGFGDDSNGELLTRWTQMGTFIPFFRNHTSKGTARQEPWAFGKKYETIIKKYIRLRYKFLFHIYNLMQKAVKTGIPVLRPVVLEFPEDEAVYNLFDQFMVGEEILAAPVYQPDRDSRMVYLPQGQWYDYWSDEIYEGGKNIIVDAPLEKMPIFIKAGSIMPLAPVMNYTGEKNIDRLQLLIYPGEKVDGYYQLYEDDGISFDYMQGKYSLKEFSYRVIDNKIDLEINKIHQGYEAGYDSYEFQIKKQDLTFRNIKIDGENISDYEYLESENKIIVSRDD